MINPATGGELYLLNDSVHLIKSMQNIWIKSLAFNSDSCNDQSILTADLVNLYKFDSCAVLRCVKDLNRKSIVPNNIERQQVIPVLAIFSDTCELALLKYKFELDISQGTIKIIRMFARFWKIVNVKTRFQSVQFRDTWKAVIQSVNDVQLVFE